MNSALEQERARLLRARLSGKQANTVVTTWMAFSYHAQQGSIADDPECRGRCHQVAQRCRQMGLLSVDFYAMVPDLCAVGRPLFEEWRLAVTELRMAPAGIVQQEMPA